MSPGVAPFSFVGITCQGAGGGLCVPILLRRHHMPCIYSCLFGGPWWTAGMDNGHPGPARSPCSGQNPDPGPEQNPGPGPEQNPGPDPEDVHVLPPSRVLTRCSWTSRSTSWATTLGCSTPPRPATSTGTAPAPWGPAPRCAASTPCRAGSWAGPPPRRAGCSTAQC